MKQAADTDHSLAGARPEPPPPGLRDIRAKRSRTIVRTAPMGDGAADAGLGEPLRAVLAEPGDPAKLESLRRAVCAQARRARALGRPARATIGAVQQLLAEARAAQPSTRELEALLLWRTIRWVESEYA